MKGCDKMYCTYCQKLIREDSSFCSNCGTKVSATQDDSLSCQKNSLDGTSFVPNPFLILKEFKFESFRGGFLYIRGLGKHYLSEVTCTPINIKIVMYSGKYKISSRPKKEIILNKTQIVSVKKLKKIEWLPAFVTCVLFTATFVLSPWYALLTILGVFSMFSKLLQISLSNGEKINIRYSSSDPYIEFMEYFSI